MMSESDTSEADFTGSSKWYFFSEDEQVRGPLSIQELANCLNRNDIQPDTFVYNKRFMKKWKKLQAVDDLLQLLYTKPVIDRSTEYPNPPFGRIKQKTESPRDAESKARQTTSPGMTSPRKSSKYKVGDVVLLDKNRSGRILYCGEVDFAKGVFYGIELIRGKGQHDGMIDDRRYFTCKAGSGVMISRKQIVRKLKRQKDIELEYSRQKWRKHLKLLQGHGFSDDHQSVKLLEKHGTAKAVLRAAENQIWSTLMGEQKKAKKKALRPVDQWGVGQVKNWVASINNGKFLEYATFFEENQIDGAGLSILTEKDLEDIGIFIMGHRKAIAYEIKQLNQQSTSYKLNDDVLLTKNRTGWIRYIGDVFWDDGTWFGVELTKARGTNDGCVDGRQYFNCRENFGTFVQEKEIIKKLSYQLQQPSSILSTSSLPYE